MISLEDAMAHVLNGVPRLAQVRLPLEQADARVLAHDVVSHAPMPAFAQSAMDGYAVASDRFDGEAPWALPVRGESRAGAPAGRLEPGTCCRIFTGAVIPAGADAVEMQENVRRSGGDAIFERKPFPGQNIRARGADLAAGVVALAAGSRLTPGRLGLAASLDHAHLWVGRAPSLTLLSTGDELRFPGAPGPEGTIAESNSYVIAALARRAGAVPRVLPMVADDPARTAESIRQALAGTDLLVTVGGASVGDHDLVRPAMDEVGVRLAFSKVAIKPGKPVAFGAAGSTRVLCLPGNPASATLTFLLFGMPLLRAMQGDAQPRPPQVPTRVLGSHTKQPGRQEYLRARLCLHDGESCARLDVNQSSGAVRSLADADALVVMPAAATRVRDGDRLEVIRLDEI